MNYTICNCVFELLGIQYFACFEPSLLFNEKPFVFSYNDFQFFFQLIMMDISIPYLFFYKLLIGARKSILPFILTRKRLQVET